MSHKICYKSVLQILQKMQSDSNQALSQQELLELQEHNASVQQSTENQKKIISSRKFKFFQNNGGLAVGIR